jgi:hypothetical protein
MLTAAALGMFLYGFYSAGWAAVDLVRGARLELWAELGLIVFGALLALAAAFVRVRLPGGLLFAVGAMLGLQALGVHDAVHLGTGVGPQIGSAILGLTLAGVGPTQERGRKALASSKSEARSYLPSARARAARTRFWS